MRALLDVNVLIALLDEEHIHHRDILDWLGRADHLPHGFATCAITQLGLIRVMSGKGYYRPVEPHVAAAQLQRITRKGHRYVEIPAPCADAVRWNSTSSAQSTDATLLSTALANKCRLVTFDTGIAVACVAGAKRQNLVVLGRAR